MTLETFVMIYGIFFWFLVAIATVCLISYTVVNWMYFVYYREDRMREQLAESLKTADDSENDENNC